jgi:carbamoyl-phosphate synthase large subunit
MMRIYMRKRILFTGAGGAGTESLWTTLSDRYELIFADACKDSIDDIIPTSNKVEIPLANAPEYLIELRKVILERKIDILVPGVDEELAIISQNSNHLKVKILLPSLEFIECMLDKLLCIKIMEEKGLAAPRTLLAEDASDIGFPQIIKPRSGRGSRGVAIVNSIEEVLAYKVFYRAKEGSIISQELAKGVEYTVLIAADMQANLKAIVPVKIIQKKGITIRATTEFQSHIVEYCKSFQSKFNVTGLYNLQCILTSTGKVIPFEINPRVSTTFCLSIAAGFDPFNTLFETNNENKVFYPEKKHTLKRNWHNSIVEINE